jgi:hypothetical protein
MTIGIGGAGTKVASKLDPEATIINVSETELSKVPAAGRRILAVVHDQHGQFKGSRKNPLIGHDAYLSVRRELQEMARGSMVFSSTGGGTGNGIATGLLRDLATRESIPEAEKTSFALILPHAPLEPAEFVRNTIEFLRGPLSEAIDSGNTGNIFLFSNRVKFESRLSEEAFNAMLVDSLRVFLAIPSKNDTLRLLDGHIDPEDFGLFTARPYFNHFTYFDYDPEKSFGKQLSDNINPLLLTPEAPIEALFLVEVPAGGDPTVFYDVLQYFNDLNVAPVYSVVENPERKLPFITVALLYSRKPAELLADFNKRNEQHAQEKVRKSIEQYVDLPRLDVNLEREAKRAVKQHGSDDDILQVLKRLGKL